MWKSVSFQQLFRCFGQRGGVHKSVHNRRRRGSRGALCSHCKEDFVRESFEEKLGTFVKEGVKKGTEGDKRKYFLVK